MAPCRRCVPNLRSRHGRSKHTLPQGEAPAAVTHHADSIRTYLGATDFARFHVDLVTAIEMTGEAPRTRGQFVPIEVGIHGVRYRVYPIADHVADKVCALLERHPRASGPAQTSTRYRDLADLALMAHTQFVTAGQLQHSIDSEARRRGFELPTMLPALDAPGWRAGYARVARDAPGVLEHDLADALTTVRRFIDPVLDGTATGSWDRSKLQWAT